MINTKGEASHDLSDLKSGGGGWGCVAELEAGGEEKHLRSKSQRIQGVTKLVQEVAGR